MSGVDAGDAGDDEVGVPQIKKAGRDQACHTNRGVDFAFARSDLTDLVVVHAMDMRVKHRVQWQSDVLRINIVGKVWACCPNVLFIGIL